MNFEIPREKWSEFFKDLSDRRFGWETKIEVFADSVGRQTLSNGLHLQGLDFEEKAGKSEIEVSVGQYGKQHQTHTIHNPARVILYPENKYRDGTIEIVKDSGAATRIRFFNPMPIMVGYSAFPVSAREDEPIF